MSRSLPYLLILLLFIGFGCNDDDENVLPSVEERTSEAISNLRTRLTEPANGWKINYHPIDQSGTFFMVLKFDEDGMVNIQSDVAANGGEFYDQTIPYRIDAALGLELIFETYGVFHYLFELQQASFGAEFEFIYRDADGDNLVFESKSDLFDKTVVAFEPATSADLEAFSREIAENFEAFAGQSPRLFGGAPPSQQLYFANQNISVFWSIDLVTRSVLVDIAGEGASIDEVLSNGSQTSINHFTGYAFRNGTLQLEEPFTANVSGTEISLSSITLTDFSMTGASLCDSTVENTPVYTGSASGLGPVAITKSLFNSGGNDFIDTDQLYTVNIPFIFDADFNSLAENGSIADKLPNAVGFVMTYDFESDTIPAYSVGFLVEDEAGDVDFYLRSFDPAGSIGNALSVDLLDEFYYTTTPNAGEEQSLREITDEIFYGSKVYAYDLDVQGLTAFQLYNPCNDYEFVLVR